MFCTGQDTFENMDTSGNMDTFETMDTMGNMEIII